LPGKRKLKKAFECYALNYLTQIRACQTNGFGREKKMTDKPGNFSATLPDFVELFNLAAVPLLG
jgi:hypothetical protein